MKSAASPSLIYFDDGNILILYNQQRDRPIMILLHYFDCIMLHVGVWELEDITIK